MLGPIGLEVSLKSGSWEQVERDARQSGADGVGSLDPMELYHHYQSGSAGRSSTTRVITATRWWIATSSRRWMPRTGRRPCRSGQVEWDGKTRRRGAGRCGLGLAAQRSTPIWPTAASTLARGAGNHGSWSLLNNLQDWRWTCR